MNRIIVSMLALASLVLTVGQSVRGQGTAGAVPTFTATGDLVVPTGYREWIFVGTGLGMTYGPNKRPAGQVLVFDNIYVTPDAYRAFGRSGKWPEQTLFVMEGRALENHQLLANEGQTQGAARYLEASVKDSSRFVDGGWGYFDFGSAQTPRPTAKRLAKSFGCDNCHAENTAVESTFVQFYPALFEVAKRFGTVKKNYDPARRF
jgi:hypothetical protein